MSELETALADHVAATTGLTPAEIAALIQAVLPIILQIVALLAKQPTPTPTPTS